MKKKSQTLNIARHLHRRGKITPIEALHVYGVFRLAARIGELRNRGWPIQTVIRRDMTNKRYAEYRLNKTEVYGKDFRMFKGERTDEHDE